MRYDLPDQPNSFIGRRSAIDAIIQRSTREKARLVTLTGPGGIGKTRLALQVAAELAGHFDDGVVFVPLASIADPTLVCTTIAQCLGIREIGALSTLRKLEEYLRSKALLLVLDNMEHLLPAAIHIGALLDGCPRLSVLVTSRAVLQLAREHVFDVPPLEVPDRTLGCDPHTLAKVEAASLFLTRAKAFNPTSQSRIPTRRQSPRSADDLMASRWRSSWQPYVSACSHQTRLWSACHRAWIC